MIQIILLGIMLIAMSVALARFIAMTTDISLLKKLQKRGLIQADLKYKDFRLLKQDIYAFAIQMFLENEKNPVSATK